VWAIFGNAGCWRLGQALARLSGCPWIGDLKDPWTRFIPAGFRRSVARRFSDCAALTALSAAHADTMRRWMPGQTARVVRSGISPAFLKPDDMESDRSGEILLCGSLYDAEALGLVLRTLAGWIDAHEGSVVRFAYAGSESDRVAPLAGLLSGRCPVEMLETLPLDALHSRQRRAAVNLHIPCPPVLFHHKVFELFAADRPVISCPGESAETRRLAEEVGATLLCCDNADALAAAFDSTLRPEATAARPVDRTALARYAWDAQADILETVLEQAVGTAR
jgi:hypothetical protein